MLDVFHGRFSSETSPLRAGSFLGRRFRRFTLRLGRRFGFSRLALGRFRSSGIFLCGFFVILAAVISNVKAAAFENQACTGADFFGDLTFTPFLLSTKFLGADG